MNRMKQILCTALISLFILLLFGCHAKEEPDYTKGDAAEFVKNAARAITNRTDTPDLFYSEDPVRYDLDQQAVLQPNFFITHIKVKTDESDPSLVHYSCRFPGAAWVYLSATRDKYFQGLDKYCPWISFEGDLHIVTDEEGNRQIDITDGDNVFAAFVSIRYISPSVLASQQIDLSDGTEGEERTRFFKLILLIACEQYGKLLGMTSQDYANQVVNPELTNIYANLETLNQRANHNVDIQDTTIISIWSTSTGLEKVGMILLYGICFIGSVVLILYLILGEGPRAFLRKLRYPSIARSGRGKTSNVREAISQLSYPRHAKLLKKIASSTGRNRDERIIALRILPYPEERDFILHAVKDSNPDYAETAINKLPYPQEKEILRQCASSDNRRALMKLPYPEEREILVKQAVSSASSDCRSIAVRKLTYDQERETLVNAALHDEDADVRVIAAEQLRYPGDAESIRKILSKDTVAGIRGSMIRKLPYPQEREALLKAMEKESESANRLAILKKLSYPEEAAVFERTALEDETWQNRLYALEQLTYQDSKEALLQAAKIETNEKARGFIRKRIPYLEETDAFVEFVLKDEKASTEDLLKASISLYKHPYSSEKILRHLCLSIQEGMKSGADDDAVTLAGWSSAALGKVLTAEFLPEQVQANEQRFELAINRYNEIVGKIQEVQVNLTPFEGQRLDYLKYEDRDNVRAWMRQIEGYQEELNQGLGIFMMDNQDIPFTYLRHLLNDQTSRIPRFVKQGVIMGLLDWLLQNKDQPDVKKLLDNVVDVRRDLIQSDNQLSFFEVRVPKDINLGDYASILADVLHTANPSVRFCDTNELLKIVQLEVKGCFNMLRECPLRLIDPAEEQTLGFFKFKPYLHMLWIQYQPPEKVGKVISRYHEVDDRTRPLSSGLSIRLFLDPYAVIPTIFHEYQHFSGDRNEASVFLKTQMFSIAFYKKYRKANARRDGVFAEMTSMLGMPPKVENIQLLNDKIKECYGERVSKEKARKNADQEIEKINGGIYMKNMTETWDPKVKYPLLTEEEDKKDRDLIHDVIVRFQTAPKSITEEEFAKITET